MAYNEFPSLTTLTRSRLNRVTPALSSLTGTRETIAETGLFDSELQANWVNPMAPRPKKVRNLRLEQFKDKLLIGRYIRQGKIIQEVLKEPEILWGKE